MQRLLGAFLAALLLFACPAWAQKESTFPRATSVLPTDLVMLVRPGNTQPNVMAPVSMLPGGGTGSCCVIHGATSGTITLAAPAIAGTHTITFPAQSFDLSATGGTNQVLQQTSAGGPITAGQLAASQLSNGVTGSGAVALAVSPALTGTPTAPTAAPGTNTTQIATTAFVIANAGGGGFIFTLNGHPLSPSGGSLNLVPTDINTITGSGAFVLAGSPTLLGVPLAPTAATGTNTTQIATTAFVQAAVTAAGAGFTLGSTPITLGTTVPIVAGLTLAGPTTTGQFKTTGATTGIAWLDAYEDVNASGIYTEWGMPTWVSAVSNRAYNINGGGNIFQFTSALSSTGSMNATALYGSARSKSSNSGVWSLNTTATCDAAGGSCVSYEADIASTVPGAANAIGILLSTAQLGCVPTGSSCHPNASYQVNTNVIGADISNYLSHSLNRGYIPSFNIGTLFASAQLVVGGVTYNTPAVTGILIQACCYNSNIVSGIILPSVGFIDVTTATFSSYEWNSSNVLIGPTINNVANKVQLVGAVAGQRSKIQTTGEANRGITIAGTGTGFVDIGNIGTQAGVCVGPVASGSAPVLTSCGGESGGTDGGLVINTTSGKPVLFPVPLGFPNNTVAGWGTCDGSKAFQRVMVSDGSGTGFRNVQPGGGGTTLPIYCDGGGSWRNGSNQWYCADVNHRRIATNDNDYEDCRTAHNRRLAA